MISPNFNVQNNVREEFVVTFGCYYYSKHSIPVSFPSQLFFNINNTLIEESHRNRMPESIITSQSYYIYLSHYVLYIKMFYLCITIIKYRIFIKKKTNKMILPDFNVQNNGREEFVITFGCYNYSRHCIPMSFLSYLL